MPDVPLLSPGGNDVEDNTGRGLEVLPDLLVRPLADNHEWRHVLHADLTERLQRPPGARTRGDSPGQAAAWLAAHPRTGGLVRKRNLIWLAAIAAVLLLAATGLQLWKFAPSLAGATRLPLLQDIARRQLYDLPPSEAPYDPMIDRRSDKVSATRRGWQAHPDNPALFYAYAVASLTNSRRLPDRYEETWRRIDPDNGYWLSLQAAEPVWQSHLLPPGSATGKSTVLEQLTAAAALPRWESPRAAYQDYVARHRRPSPSLPVSEDRRFSNSFDRIQEDATVWSILSQISAAASLPPPFIERLDQEAEVIEASQPFESFSGSRGDAEVESGIYFLSGFMPALAAVIFSFCTLAVVLRLLPWKGRPGRMAACLAPLLKPGDVWAVAASGLAVPVLVAAWMAVQTTRDSNLPPREGMVMALAAVGMIVNMVQAARLVALRRLACLGMASSAVSRVAGWGSVVAYWVAFFFMVQILDLLTRHGPRGLEPTLAVAGALAGCALMWIPLRVLFGYTSPDGNVRHRLLARVLLPALLIVIGSFGILSVAVYPLELRSIARMEAR